MSNYTPTASGTDIRAKIQRFGGYLAGMVMPNIGAFIAWGLITAIFLPDNPDNPDHSGGWIPNDDIGAMIGPIIVYLLPILIGYTGGRVVHGQRGAVIGAVATMGVIVGTDGTPMFLGAMIIAPLSAFLLKLLDDAVAGKVKPGFEMLIDNFSLGILGAAMAVVGLKWLAPPILDLVTGLGNMVEKLYDQNLLPLMSLIIEPAKVLFLNNAINHGVLTPLGTIQAHDAGKSILFMLESNPGPGLGLLLAYLFFGPRSLRPTVPAAIIVHFFGGIHEIYFPYVLMRPQMILSTIAGGMTGIATFKVLDAGLVAAPAPGSIFAYLLETPKGGYFAVLTGVTLAAAAAFAVGSALLGFGRGSNDLEPLSDVEMTKREEAQGA